MDSGLVPKRPSKQNLMTEARARIGVPTRFPGLVAVRPEANKSREPHHHIPTGPSFRRHRKGIPHLSASSHATSVTNLGLGVVSVSFQKRARSSTDKRLIRLSEKIP